MEGNPTVGRLTPPRVASLFKKKEIIWFGPPQRNLIFFLFFNFFGSGGKKKGKEAPQAPNEMMPRGRVHREKKNVFSIVLFFLTLHHFGNFGNFAFFFLGFFLM